MNLRAMLIRDEGKRYVAYPDPLTGAEPATIGVGHTEPGLKIGDIWTDAQIDAALDADIAKSLRGCLEHFSPWFENLTEARQSVLIAMAFQLGVGGLLKFVKMIAAVRDEHYEHAANEMRDSRWYQQTPKRCARMALQLATGDWQ